MLRQLRAAPAASHHHRAAQCHRTAVRVATQAAAAPAAAPRGWASSETAGTGSRWSIAVLGDLHLEPGQMHLFEEARQQLLDAMGDAGGGQSRVVSLGDLGGYNDRPGSRACFKVAADYLAQYGLPVALVTGNHDLEGDEFESDAANLAAWRDAFQQHHHWALPLGPVLAIGLSTVRFRTNAHSVHEVYIDDEQVAWLEAQLAANRHRPVVIFTHAPPLGSGLKVVQHVHVKNRCAWLNHSDRPQRFVRLVEAHDNIKLWFSGHFHLSQNYVDSISVVGSCAFVQTGVIGDCNRDGKRQSRLLRFDDQGYELLTVDHGDGGQLRLDLAHSWASPASPVPITPEHELLCDPAAGWLCSELDCALPDASGGSNGRPRVQWLAAGPNCMLAVQEELVVEYDMEMRAPVGLVAFLEPGQTVSLVDASGAPPRPDGDGSDAAALLIADPASGQVVKRLARNEQGTFFVVMQPNKWRAKQAAAAAAAAQEEAAAAVAVGSS